jgi:hypothetical protein
MRAAAIRTDNVSLLVAALFVAGVMATTATPQDLSISAGDGLTITGVYREPGAPVPSTPPALRQANALAETTLPVPRLAGFSPLVALTLSDERQTGDGQYEHQQEFGYVGNPLGSSASTDFILAILDSGSDVNLAAGSSRDDLALSASFITDNVLPIGGVGGTLDANITWPIAYFGAGLEAVNPDGSLDLAAVKGHSNVSGLAAPPIACVDTGEVVRGIVGMPFITLWNHVINVDDPREVMVRGERFQSPNVTIQPKDEPLPAYAHLIPLEFGGLSPTATTANWYPDFFDLETPLFPTLMSLSPLSIPFGGAFFTEIELREGPAGGNNFPEEIRVLVDTGAQSSIISRAVAAELNLPLEPDFTVDVCGIGGATTAPGYYIDYVRISALGGALEYAQAPFVVIDLQSPEGGSLDGILGMNFFYDRNVILEPGLTTSAFLHASARLPVSWADADVDFDVDALDAEYFTTCLTPTGLDAVLPQCTHIDRDGDGDVDLSELAAFQAAFTGPN